MKNALDANITYTAPPHTEGGGGHRAEEDGGGEEGGGEGEGGGGVDVPDIREDPYQYTVSVRKGTYMKTLRPIAT